MIYTSLIVIGPLPVKPTHGNFISDTVIIVTSLALNLDFNHHQAIIISMCPAGRLSWVTSDDSAAWSN